MWLHKNAHCATGSPGSLRFCTFGFEGLHKGGPGSNMPFTCLVPKPRILSSKKP